MDKPVKHPKEYLDNIELMKKHASALINIGNLLMGMNILVDVNGTLHKIEDENEK